MHGQHRFHLRRLDAEAPELDLIIEPPRDVHDAVGLDHARVSAAVDAPRAVRPAQKTLRGEVGQAEVAARHARPADAQLTGLARLGPAAVGPASGDRYAVSGPAR